MINKNDLCSLVSKETGFTKKDIEVVVNSIFNTITNQNANGEAVNIVGFGKFDIADRPAREGRNPQTGEPINIKARRVPKFKPSITYKDAIN